MRSLGDCNGGSGCLAGLPCRTLAGLYIVFFKIRSLDPHTISLPVENVGYSANLLSSTSFSLFISA